MLTRRKRKIPQVNSSASADIAFLLLVFFLITSSMGSEKGIFKRLIPSVAENVVKQKKEIKKRNLLRVSIDAENEVFCNNKLVAIDKLQDLALEFIENSANLDSLPEKEMKMIPFFGEMPITTNHIIALEISRGADYDAYISVQNELIAAYNELRERLAKSQFHSTFAALEPDKQASIREIYSQRITELELPQERKEGRE